MKLRPEEISSVLSQELNKYDRDLEVESVGTILQVGDGIARIYGLQQVMAGELVEFEDGTEGIAQADRARSQRNRRQGRAAGPVHRISHPAGRDAGFDQNLALKYHQEGCKIRNNKQTVNSAK